MLRGGAVPLEAVHERVEVVVKVVYRVPVEEEGRVIRGGRSEDEMGCALKEGMSRMGSHGCCYIRSVVVSAVLTCQRGGRGWTMRGRKGCVERRFVIESVYHAHYRNALSAVVC